MRLRSALLIIVFFPCVIGTRAQDDARERGAFRDTLDGALDLSRFLIEKNGFVPVMMLITEPALGGIGAAVAPVFLQQKRRPDGGYIAPDMTAAFGMYSANGTWGAGGGRVGTIVPWGLRYRAFAAYADVNMDFYRRIDGAGEQRVGMNMKAIPVLLQAIKQIGASPWYGGLRYTWSKVTSASQQQRFADLFPENELERTTSLLGAVFEFDKRDNVFSPDHGIRGHIDHNVSAEAIGSDFAYQKGEFFLHAFFPVRHGWTSGLRFQADQVWGDPAYYQLPFLELRGIPMMRYQGRITTLVETEQRIHVWKRWSTVAFLGAGRAADSWDDYEEADTPVNYGFGPRYLIARAFKLQMGVDVAWGPDGFAWYVVFGNAWIR